MPRNFITVVRESRGGTPQSQGFGYLWLCYFSVEDSRWSSGNGNWTLNRCNYYNKISENRAVAWNQKFNFRIGKR
jgi:hypothetical protein